MAFTSDLHNQDLVQLLSETTRIAAGKPGQEGADNIEYRDLRAQIGSDLGIGIFRVPLSAVSTQISIPLQAALDYEIEVVIYRLDDGADGKELVVITQKTLNSFNVELPSGYENGVFVYRVLSF